MSSHKERKQLPREPSGAAALLVSAATMLCALATGMDGWVANGWAVDADQRPPSVPGGNVARMKRLLGQFICTLLLVALVLHFIWWIIGAAALVGGVWLGTRMWLAQRATDLAERKRLDAIRARADQQLRWMLAGDERGIYGPDGAALMRDIRRGCGPAGSPTWVGAAMRGQPRRQILNMSGGPRAALGFGGTSVAGPPAPSRGGTHERTSSALAHVALP